MAEPASFFAVTAPATPAPATAAPLPPGFFPVPATSVPSVKKLGRSAFGFSPRTVSTGCRTLISRASLAGASDSDFAFGLRRPSSRERDFAFVSPEALLWDESLSSGRFPPRSAFLRISRPGFSSRSVRSIPSMLSANESGLADFSVRVPRSFPVRVMKSFPTPPINSLPPPWLLAALPCPSPVRRPMPVSAGNPSGAPKAAAPSSRSSCS